MRDYLVSEITKREGEIDETAQRIRIIETELRVLRDVLAQYDKGNRAGLEYARRGPAEPQKNRGAKGSRIGPRWRPVTVAALQRYPEFLRNEDVAEIQRLSGQPPGRISEIRSHVYTYVRDGLYERGEAGAFRATPKAAEAMGIRLGPFTNDGKVSSQEEPGSGQPRLGLNDLESVEAVDAARKAGGT